MIGKLLLCDWPILSSAEINEILGNLPTIWIDSITCLHNDHRTIEGIDFKVQTTGLISCAYQAL